MTELTDAEQQLLVIIQRAHRAQWDAHMENLLSISREKLGRFLLDWTEAIESLQKRGLVEKSGELYSLTEAGQEVTSEVQRVRPISYYWYNEYYLRAEQSRAHGEFLRRVYGKDLCQHGIMDMAQLDDMLEVLKLGKDNRVLELGCGNGMITEYISDRTRAHVTGMDIADVAIRRANERTEAKRDRLQFDAGSMYRLEYPPHSFDTIIAIDTLYFVTDIEETLRQVEGLMKPGGQMGIYYGTLIIGSETTGEQMPDRTKLALALATLGMEYNTIDYTEADREHWKLKEKVLHEMKPEFEAESNLFLWNNRIAECESVPEGEPGRRYLYHVYNVGGPR